MGLDFRKQYQTLPNFQDEDAVFNAIQQRQLAGKDDQFLQSQGIGRPEDPISSDMSANLPPGAPPQTPPQVPPVTPLQTPPVRPIASAPPASQDSSDDATRAAVTDEIKKKYGFGPGLDDAALKAAQSKQNDNTFAANLGEAFNDIGHAVSRAPGKVDNSFYQGLRDQAGMPTQQIMARRKGEMENLQMGKAQAEDDPNSPQAKALQGMVSRMFPGKFKPEELSAITVDMSDKILKPIELKSAIDERLQAAQLRRDYMMQGKRETADARVTKGQADADSKLGEDYSKFEGRGENKVYAEAMRRGKNIQDLINQAPGGDLNKLSLHQTHLLTKEIDGFINGGAPTVAGVSGDAVDNLAQSWAKFKEKIGNKPQGAQLGAFIEQQIPYVKDVMDSSRKYLYTKKKRLLDSYNSKLSPDAFARHSKELEEDFGSPATPAVEPNQDDQQAIQWASQNPNDPRATKILQLHGMK